MTRNNGANTSNNTWKHPVNLALAEPFDFWRLNLPRDGDYTDRILQLHRRKGSAPA